MPNSEPAARAGAITGGAVYEYIWTHLPGGADPITYGDVHALVKPLLEALTTAQQREAEAVAQLQVSREIGDTFWEALKPLNLPAINVHNPGQHVTDLREENARLRSALKEIAKGEGAFSLDPLTHAGNVIEHAKEIAHAALTPEALQG